MYHLLPSSVMNPGYAGTPSLATSPGWSSRQPRGGGGGASRERRRVTIFRNSLDTPWGFRVQGGKDLNAPLSVKRAGPTSKINNSPRKQVFSGSPAHGQLTRDDLILAIDDQPADGLSSAQVSETIRSAGTSIVLTIETSPYDSASDNSFVPIRSAVQHQQPKQEPVQQSQPKKHETKASDHHSFHSSPSANYEASPPADSGRQTASAPYSKATATTGHHRSANRNQATQVVPCGLSEPGWAPKSKPAAKESPTATTAREPTATTPSEAPVSQHRSARQQHAKPPGSSGGGDASWRSQYAAVDDPNAPSWYGSLRSNRAAHQWEVRAAKEAQSPGAYADTAALQNVPTEPVSQRNTRRQPEPTESQQSRTYKAEVHGLMLARPAYHQAQSTPEWEEAPGRGHGYRTPGQARSAPETPTADTCGRTICSDVQAAAPYQAAAYSQQHVDGSAPVKIQPSLLFGNRSATKPVQSPSQTRVPARAQPQEIKVTPHVGQPREEIRASGFQLVSTRKEPAVSVFKVPATHQAPTATKVVSVPQARAAEPARGVPSSLTPVTVVKPVEEPPKATPRVLPTVQAESATPVKPIERFNPVPDTRQSENLSQAQKARPSSQIEHYHVTSDRSQKTAKSASESPVKFTQTPVERFNPTPDKREKVTQPSVLHSQVKSQTTTLVERFNPTPDKGEKTTKSPVSYSQVKSQATLVERFNPTPDTGEKQIKSPVSYSHVKSQPQVVERFNPTPDKGEKPTKSPVSYSQVKSQPQVVERFNPTPDKQERVSYSQVKSQPQVVERFNPTPDKGEKSTKSPVSYSQVKSQPQVVERFNPTPDKQDKPSKAPVALSPPKPLSAPLESTSQQPARVAKPTAISAPLKVSLTPIERFNPTPDRPQNIPRATATHISKNILQAPLERFNPTPDPPPKVPQRQIERFNPVPDRP